MLAYRHAFHAGNHADVLKHLVLLLVLQHMNQKDKGYRLVDTHAGAGGYSLKGRYARKNAEFEQGIGRLWGREDLPEPVADYVRRVRDFNGGGALDQYPGSPALARTLLRPQDELRLFEMHPTEFRILSDWLGGERGVQARMADGFEGLKSQLPPPTRRAVVLIDPAYEQVADYGRVLAAVRDALVRFEQALILVWIPQVGRVEAAQLPKRLQSAAPKGWLHARMTVQATDERGFGLQGSSLFVFNPPHTLHGQLQGLLPWLHTALRQFDGGGWLLDQRSA